VRGLGLRQFKDRVSTYHKILFTLSLEPCTFTQLRKITRIQRNALSMRLKQLIHDGLVLVHVILETGYLKGRSRSSKRRYYFMPAPSISLLYLGKSLVLKRRLSVIHFRIYSQLEFGGSSNHSSWQSASTGNTAKIMEVGHLTSL